MIFSVANFLIDIRDLPTLNAMLNGSAAVLLGVGYWLIRSRHRLAHKRVMLTAFAVSVAFLASYLLYHYQVGSIRFQRTGAIRSIYLAILATHSILAAAVPVLAVITLYRAAKGRLQQHRRIARWTLPIWLYVSVTGVTVYWMLYRM